MTRFAAGLALVWLTLGLVPAHAQTTLKVSSRIVLLDVAVTDAKGNPVLDLKPEEFRVYEQKVEQKVLSFEPPSAHLLPSELAGKEVVNGTADLPKIGQAPVTLLILDELNMSREDQIYAKSKLIAWLERQPAVLPQPTALLAITYTDFHLLRDYTQDRDTLVNLLKRHSSGIDWRRDNTGRVGEQASMNMFATLGALEQVAQATRGLPGRKNVVWVGDGFPSINTTDASRTTGAEIEAALRRLSGVLLRARVTLSIAGPALKAMVQTTIETQQDEDAAQAGNLDHVLMASANINFGDLAPPTGGRAYSSRNDLDAEIGQAISEGQSYYTLSYRPSSSSDDLRQYRRIRVVTTRPGLTVQTRDGYFEEPKELAAPVKIPEQQLAFDLFGAAMSTLPYPDLHLTVERKDMVDYVLHAAARDMTWRDLPDGRRHTNLVLLAVCLSRNGKMLSKTFATLGSTTESDLRSINQVTASLPMKVSSPPGTARIRFVVRDMEGGHVGTADYTP